MHSDSPNDSWAIRFAQFVQRFGTLKLSILFVVLSLVFTLGGSYVIRVSMGSQVQPDDFISAVILTMLSAPWVLYFFSELIKQLENSRTNLKEVVSQLESLREEDVFLNRELQSNIRQLNHEIEQRKQAQEEREALFKDLEREIQDKSEQEAQARRLSTLLRSIIDASPDLIYYRNEEGRFAGCNRIAELMTGKTEQELLGLTPKDVYEEELARQIVASDHEVLETNASITEELWLRFADGRRRYFEMKRVPFFDKEGNRLGLLSFGRDMTERKQAENAAAKASTDKTRFIATISHELRTPLNGIVGLSRMLRDTELSDEQFSWVSTIYASAITLGNIFNDIIDLDKLDRDKLELSLKTISLKDFTEELSSIIRLLAADKQLELKTSINEPLPRLVEIDGTRLRQILWNILFNAVKFTQKGHVSLSVSSTKPDGDKAYVTFVIEDTGVGIPESEIDKIFAMYYQVDHPDHQSATGTGIGLAICKQMVDLMNGEIHVSSKEGKGTRFEIVLPVQISNSPMKVAQLQVTGLNILLVEDIELNVMVAKALLEKLGQKVDVAMTGQEAIDKARANQYDLILLDIQLPDMTGFDVASTLIEEDLVMQTPIVALTANVIKKRDEYLENGMDDVIAKPIKKSRVIEVFNDLFHAPPAPLEVDGEVERPEPTKTLSNILDMDLLQMLVDTIGDEMVRASVKVFQEKMPEYMEILQLSLSADEKSEVCSQAHKIKGAAGSVGLARVQRIANQIQQGDHPTWWENVHDWVEELQMAVQHDMKALHDWLNEQQVDD
ncbi:aerobic respiration two-component sensor histidine kinase ArcB [Alteromonas mediterranea]|jgi:two-component system, OmpR family, aerobic respiration control sensor histidine kinase ArcB|uniref:Aerobic respiration control sensor protein n=4 Tax=Alteromonas mediterranea TaxID=314275 RepID=A0AAC9NSL2_9ALTE|nr:MULTISPECIES: aerobic respiration two-component sensor histidine kinase ArcB [Alteromonas]AGP94741.1 aerobic respiration control sensor protein ArcB [Alteromonas mediterranea U8]MBR9785194.1 aerobic respiration two-component sensor histidine kinase ArcB [Gammaproteobacteria bacterium]MEA3379919.1 aerobic respiration two-component sensor histidine kinase ArcB [Pseudomonadota bacterium]AEA99286.1 aerobic respiration control protein ArcB [Alteromonas mediterranea DE]AGP82916.1 aerobic respirat|tara:strand:+ start:1700 stop:4054 length:2355 start_codon:yes stop_codon:yes gene_type:complete